MKLGIDIGGTTVPYGLVDKNNLIVLEDVVYLKDMDSIKDLFLTILNNVQAFDSSIQLEGVGIGAPNGHHRNGTIEHAPNLPWKGVIPIFEIAQEVFNVPIVIDNDANVAALGEAKFGIGKQYNSFVHLTLGTGLGAGIIIDGKIFRGSTMMAGELGHTTLISDGRPCNCGKKGCLETYASVTGVWNTAIEFSKQDNSMDCDEMSSPHTCSTKIYHEAENNNPNAKAIFDFTGDKLAHGIANIHYILGTEAFILGGGLSKAGKHLLDPTLKHLKKYTTPLFNDQFSVMMSQAINGELVILGATALLDA